jgi:hypothetical protein
MKEVQVHTKNGSVASYVGLEICEGPGVMRLLLTWPYERSAEIVEIPVEKIQSVTEIEQPHPLGATPRELT